MSGVSVLTLFYLLIVLMAEEGKAGIRALEEENDDTTLIFLISKFRRMGACSRWDGCLQ